MKRWFILYTEPRAEAKAAVRVAPYCHKVFIPMTREFERQGKWMLPVERGVLFPRYIFIVADDGEYRTDWKDILEAKGVVDVLRSRGRPAPVPYRAIRAIRTRDRKVVKKKAEPKFKIGQQVLVTTGAFESFMGKVDGMTGEARVKVLLSLFGRETRVELRETDVCAA